jgi:hypothetical protein
MGRSGPRYFVFRIIAPQGHHPPAFCGAQHAFASRALTKVAVPPPAAADFRPLVAAVFPWNTDSET